MALAEFPVELGERNSSVAPLQIINRFLNSRKFVRVVLGNRVLLPPFVQNFFR